MENKNTSRPFPPGHQHWNPHVRAILVGITDYASLPATPDLPPGQKDAALMADALIFGLRIAPDQIWAKTRDGGTMTRDSFLTGIRLFLSDIGPEDVVIFYFSGHGMVRHSRHLLLFSDGAIETQSLIDLFAELHVRRRILFLDCCMSGHFRIPGEEDRSPALFASKGGKKAENARYGETAVFSACREAERAGYDVTRGVSAFTSFLWNAMTNRWNLACGCRTLEQIRTLVMQDASAWNERYPEHAQHPVFRSSIEGTVSFCIASDEQKLVKTYAADRPDYQIREVLPLHSQVAKRYAVRVLLKHTVTELELARITNEAAEHVKGVELYRSRRDERMWMGRPVNLVFFYFGYSLADLADGCCAFRTVWADETQDRTHWYRIKPDSRILDGIWLQRNPSYGWLHRLVNADTAENLLPEDASAGSSETAGVRRVNGSSCVKGNVSQRPAQEPVIENG